MKVQAGSYVLLMQLRNDTTITVGKLGIYAFNRGYYLYAGSALNGLKNRLMRHLNTDKKNHWHVDYLINHTEIVEIWGILSPERLECTLAQACCALPNSKIPVRGFGASDCRCSAHLIYLPEKPARMVFQSVLNQISNRNITVEALSIDVADEYRCRQ